MDNQNEKKVNQKFSKKENAGQAIKYALFSTSAGIIEMLSFTLMNLLTDLPYWPCYLTALILSVLFNFTVNRRYTFKSANNIPKAMLQVLCFYLVFTPVSTYLGALAEGNGVNDYLVLYITMAFNFTLEFLYWRFVVYRGTINTNKLAKRKEERERQKQREKETLN